MFQTVWRLHSREAPTFSAEAGVAYMLAPINNQRVATRNSIKDEFTPVGVSLIAKGAFPYAGQSSRRALP
jgi:hypothetical protein